jgi:outer membrane murein-binding lipoprotein Lpp
MYVDNFKPAIEGTTTMKPIVVKLAAVALLTGLAGCTDLKPLQADIDQLKTQVSNLQVDIHAAQASADAAARAARAAQNSADQASQAARTAQSTASQALTAASAAQASSDANSEKINRMFKKSVSK